MTTEAARHVPELEDEGIPDHEGALESKELTGDGQEGIMPPRDRPIAATDYGITAEEHRRGEPLEGRIRRELPDPALDIESVNAEADDLQELSVGEPVGRLVEDDEGARTDSEKDAVAHDVGPDHGGFSAEEAAMHVVAEP